MIGELMLDKDIANILPFRRIRLHKLEMRPRFGNGIQRVNHPELIFEVGDLRFRHSFGQPSIN